MKNVLLTIVVLTGMTVLGVASYNHYQENKPQAKAVVAESRETVALKTQVNDLTSTLVKTKNDNAVLLVECNKGKVAYEKLTPVQKKSAQVPNCAAVQ